jgi:hypothetical protein
MQPQDDKFVSMRRISKRELVRRPSVVSHLKPGESVVLEDGKIPLVVSRPKSSRLTPKEIEAEIQRLCQEAPELDCQAVLDDLRE